MLHVSSQRLTLTSSRFCQAHCFSFYLQRSLSIVPHVVDDHTHSNPSVSTHNEVLDFFDYLLQQFNGIQQCKQVHGQIVTTGTYRSTFLAARLVSVYSRCGLLIDAHKVFDTYSVEGMSSLLLWNAIVRANVFHGFYKKVLELFDKMLKFGVWPDGFTFPLIVRACALMGGHNLCRSVHNHILVMGFQNNFHVVNELLGMYGKLGRMEDAYKLFEKMTVRRYFSWNIMISGYAFNYDCDSAMKMFQLMDSEGFVPNPVAWTSLLSSHARCGRHEEAMALFGVMRLRGVGATAEALAVILSLCADLGMGAKGRMIHGYLVKGGFENYLFAKNALLDMYGKCGSVGEAKKLFLEMDIKNLVSWNTLITSFAESGLCDEALEIFTQLENSDCYSAVQPNVITWSAVICGFVGNGRGEKSLELFRKMQLTEVMANNVTISSVLSVCAALAALNLGREIHGHVVRVMMDGNILVANGLINMYAKCGSFREGHIVFENLDNKDLVSWNSMIAGYGMHGLGENALRIFYQMISFGFKPDNVTFIVILSACSHAALINEGQLLFDRMITDYGIEPKMEHYACMVDLLGRAGLLQEASEMVKNMPMKPNACIWSALMNSSMIYKNTSFATVTTSHFVDMNLEMTGSYMLLSNIYAASGRWEDSAKARILTKEKGLKKIAGQSWIEVKRKVYLFSSGSPIQEGLQLVYDILQELALHMKSESYAPSDDIIQQEALDLEMKMIIEGH